MHTYVCDIEHNLIKSSMLISKYHIFITYQYKHTMSYYSRTVLKDHFIFIQ